MGDEIDLSICIVNWNAGQFLLDCLASLQHNLLGPKYEVIVVDNASTDDSVKQVQARFPQVKVIQNERNDGFAVANDIAIGCSSGRYILLLNPDTLTYVGALEQMIAFMDAHRQVGACGCRLVHPQSGKIEPSARGFPTLLRLLWYLSYLDRLFPRCAFFSAYQMTYQNVNEPHQVDSVTGACLMARREAIAQVRGLDERFFMYCEDTDLCYRLKEAGWQVYYLPQVQLGHYRGQSSKLKLAPGEAQLGIWGAQQYALSMLYFYHKHYGRARTRLLRVTLVVTAVLRAGLWLLGGTLRYGWRAGIGRARSCLAVLPIATTGK